MKGLLFLMLAIAIAFAVGWLVLWLGERQIGRLHQAERRARIVRLRRFSLRGRREG